MYEKRVHIRVPVGLEGSYQPIARLAPPRMGMTRDVSLGGARFVSTERMEPSSKISMVLSMPKEGELGVTGLVVWSRPADQGTGQMAYESGLCWENVDARAQARLNSFLTDYTRTDEASVVISSLPPGLLVSWPRTLAFGIGVALLLVFLLSVLLRLNELRSENGSLRWAIESYQQQIDHVVLHSR